MPCGLSPQDEVVVVIFCESCSRNIYHDRITLVDQAELEPAPVSPLVTMKLLAVFELAPMLSEVRNEVILRIKVLMEF